MYFSHDRDIFEFCIPEIIHITVTSLDTPCTQSKRVLNLRDINILHVEIVYASEKEQMSWSPMINYHNLS